jgi:predicted acyltransferase
MTTETGRGDHIDALDVLRGATIAAMILVNNPGDWNTVFPSLVHADWNGLTFADVVFPFFVFIMGCAMPFAFARRDAAGPWRTDLRLLRRVAALVGLGLVLNLVLVAPAFSRVRIPGVLQRLGVAYFFAALIVRSFGVIGQAAAAAVLALGHWAALTLVPFAGHAFGLPTPNHNLAGYIDARVFGLHTLKPGFDPEGLLGVAPTVSTAIAGALAGQWLRRHHDARSRLGGLTIGGAAAVAVALAWSRIWPINKPLWTGSYALLSCGLASLTLAVCLYVVDTRRLRGWVTPFRALGANPMAIYFLSELTAQLLERRLLPATTPASLLAPKDWFYWHALVPLFPGVRGEWTSLLYALIFVGGWTVFALLLDRRGIRIRV